MPKIMEIARITNSEMDPASTDIKDMARLVHAKVLGESQRQQARVVPSREDGVLGYHWRGSIKQTIRSLWPGIWNALDDEAQEALYAAIRKWLRDTKNADCVIRRDTSYRPHLPVWWINLAWNPVEPVGIVVHRNSRPRDAIDLRAEKLTPEEAGETREPEPVDVRIFSQRQKDEETMEFDAEQRRKEAFAANSERIKAEYRTKLDVICELLEEAVHPLTLDEIVFVVGGSPGAGRVALNDLMAEKRAFGRTESIDEMKLRLGGFSRGGRRGQLFSYINPVPPRTVANAISGFEHPVPVRQKRSKKTHNAQPIQLDERTKLEDVAVLILSQGKAVKNMPDAVRSLVARTGISRAEGYAVFNKLVENGTALKGRRTSKPYHSQIVLVTRADEEPLPVGAQAEDDTSAPASTTSQPLTDVALAYMRRGIPLKNVSDVVTVLTEHGASRDEAYEVIDELVNRGQAVSSMSESAPRRRQVVLTTRSSEVPSKTDRIRDAIVKKWQRGVPTKQYSGATEVARKCGLNRRDAVDFVEEMIRDRVFDVTWRESTNGGGRTRMLTLTGQQVRPSVAPAPASFPPPITIPEPAPAPVPAPTIAPTAPVGSVADAINAATDAFRQSLEQIVRVAAGDSQEELARLRAENERMRAVAEALRGILD